MSKADRRAGPVLFVGNELTPCQVDKLGLGARFDRNPRGRKRLEGFVAVRLQDGVPEWRAQGLPVALGEAP